ncbi:TIGR03885 family FMN-dependent LLM class oxidoreductase [Anditalea andensis]|uniref:5,10-methylene tetrahydromethanopterin reductase n=1 Tax=Anditalea andensis TaxID=1048983 RepID=A0A074LN73_9BACT|nr:TIGR03885 family FMN-dependent LLM class oxidoreductase [Anditalea andensis]KEO75367.1 5,10-methylene tetrahydromethanopterin reductase [Anditalea andensis]
MLKLGYHVSHEQFSPSSLLGLVEKAEEGGFQFALSSDHFYPWNEAQGQSGFAWSWLGAAMSRTSFPIGVVTCPYHRYNPAIIAQAAATLLDMFPDRFFMSVGSGQMLNEGIIDKIWPTKGERNKALEDAVMVMKKLWDGEEVYYSGHFNVVQAKLYTRPSKPPEILGAAITPITAKFVSSWADGLITINKPMKEMEEMVDAYISAGGKKDAMVLKLQVSYDPDREIAQKTAFEQWKTNIFGSDLLAQIRTPKQFEQAAEYVRPEDLHDHVHIGNNSDYFIEIIKSYQALGFERISIHNVNKMQEPFINFFSKEVLPYCD